MKLNTNLTVAIHTILCIAFFEKDNKVTSEFIAGSTGMNPVIIRKILGKLQAAGIVETKAGVGGSSLSKKTEEITLLDVYKAVSEEEILTVLCSIFTQTQIQNALLEARFMQF